MGVDYTPKTCKNNLDNELNPTNVYIFFSVRFLFCKRFGEIFFFATFKFHNPCAGVNMNI